MPIHCSFIVAWRKTLRFSWIQIGHLGMNDNLEFAASLLSSAMGQELSLGFVQHWAHQASWKNNILSSKVCILPIYVKQSIKLLVVSSEMVFSHRKLEIKSGGRSRGHFYPKQKPSWRVYCLLLKTAEVEGHPCPDKVFFNFLPIHILLSCNWSLLLPFLLVVITEKMPYFARTSYKFADCSHISTSQD